MALEKTQSPQVAEKKKTALVVKAKPKVTPAKEKASAVVKKRNGRVTMEDIAQEAGVSRRVVSRVLFPNASHSVGVSAKTAERVLEIANRKGYIPNINAMHLKGSPLRLVGVLVDSFGPEISYRMLGLLERGMAARGYRLLVGQLHNDVRTIQEYVQDFVGRGVEDLITFAHGYPGSRQELNEVYKIVNRVVYLGNRIDKEELPENAAHIYVDRREAVFMLVKHLAQRGSKRIALLLGCFGYQNEEDRIKGFSNGLKEAGLKEEDCWIETIIPEPDAPDVDPIKRELFAQAVDRILSRTPRVDAIITSNDRFALEVIRVLHKHGLRVPQDIRVTGADNMGFGEITFPSITTIDPRLEVAVQEVIGMLLDRKKEEPFSKLIRLQPKLIARESTE